MSLLARKLVRDTRRQWLQFCAVALTLGLGIAVFGAAYDSYGNLKSSYAAIYARLNFADATISGANTDAVAARLRRAPGIGAVATRVQADVPFRIGSGASAHSLIGRLVGPSVGPRTIDALQLKSGTRLRRGDADSVVLERHMAEHFHLAVGDSIEVYGSSWRRLSIVGIATSPEYLWPARDREDLLTSSDEFGVAFANPQLIAAVAGPFVTPQVLVRASGAAGPQFARTVHAAAATKGADVVLRDQQPSNAALQQDVAGFGQLALLFPLLFLAAAGLATYVLLGRLVRGQRSQIGMLRANGYPRRRLLRHYVAYGAVAGGVGSLVGAVGGLALAVWLTHSYTSALGIPLTIATFHPATPVIGLLFGTAAATLAALGPAHSATRVPPAEAMRGVAPSGTGHRVAAERLPGLRDLPVRARLALRNLARSPRRGFSTGIGVALAAVLVLSSLGLLDTVSLVLHDEFHRIQRQDAQLFFASPPTPATLSAIASVPGVAAVEQAVEAPVVLSHAGHRYQTVLTGLSPHTTMHAFASALPSTSLLLGDGLRSTLGLRAGDAVDIATPNGAPTRLRVDGFVNEPIGGPAYATVATTRMVAGDVAVASALVRYKAGANRVEMRRGLTALPEVVAFRDARASEEAVSRLLGLFYAIVGVMLVFGSVLAFVVLFNTLSVNLSERTVELATLRAAGGRVVTLARMMTGENVLLVLAAIPAGLLAGWLTAGWLMASLDSDLYHFSLKLRPATPPLLAAALIVIALAMQVPARRTIRRLDVAAIVRERAL
ncbi:MAG TPA: FtsX-like permease family protein [Acidimicrobiales bacterium]|nr:FtsX-like permease family protein [Acidimicrobiales bacterium]